MRSSPKRFSLFLIGLFLAFSFNAYACVAPVFTDIPATQESDCTMPEKEPATQFCDGFKTLAIQAGLDSPSPGHVHESLTGETTLLLPDLVPSKTFVFPPGSGWLIVQHDILLLISVFRI